MNISKDIYFVRHAESKENVKVQHFCMAIQRLKSFKLPTLKQMYKSSQLLQMETDAEVSSLGQRQLIDVSMILEEKNFWDRISSTPPLSEDAESADNADETKTVLNKLTIVYSPLSRAKITCFSVVPERFHKYCVELDCLRETTPFEHVIPYTVVERTKVFQQWLRNTDAEVIVVFGHSQYFKRLLNLKALMRNCDVWHCKARLDSDPTTSSPVTWEEPVLLHRTELAERSLLSDLFSYPSTDQEGEVVEEEESSDTNRSDDDDVNAANSASPRPEEAAEATADSEIFCRICQVTQSEAPELQLIQPCRCTGTLSYVHIQCLNTWRATSSTAFSKCSVCNFEYQVESSYWADLLRKDEVVMVLTGVIMLQFLLAVGCTAQIFAFQFPSWEGFLRELFAVVDFHWPPPICGFVQNASMPWDEVIRGGSKNKGWATTMKYLWTRGTVYWRLVRSPLLYYRIMCQQWLLGAVHSLILGTVLIGITSFGWNLVVDLQLAVVRGGNAPHYLLSLLSWVLQGNNVGFRRFMVVVGCVMSTRELHEALHQTSRRIVQWIGERILERR